ncbi:hypothetical protein RUM43_008278 [Polyplax serrata]|uniref:Uncharacterized protein n=1 Tax=Polyplax serrata TaxID=468196 RepID=A0AAN8PEI6_POLSC
MEDSVIEWRDEGKEIFSKACRECGQQFGTPNSVKENLFTERGVSNEWKNIVGPDKQHVKTSQEDANKKQRSELTEKCRCE